LELHGLRFSIVHAKKSFTVLGKIILHIC